MIISLLQLLLSTASAASLSLSVSVAPSKIGGSIPVTPLHTYFISPTGSDTANGLTPNTAWASPNHPVQCGDVIIAASGSYKTLEKFGAVSKCPSTIGGIDGTGGIYFAVLLCGGASVGDCLIAGIGNANSSAIGINANNWAVEGWKASEGYAIGQTGFAFMTDTSATKSAPLHHTAFINNVAYFNASAYGTSNKGIAGLGQDYQAIVGNIAQDSAGRCDGYFDSAIDLIETGNYDTAAGTHFFIAGNFSYNNLQPPGCAAAYPGWASDGESLMLDTLDAHATTGKVVVKNNILSGSHRMGLHIFFQNQSTVSLPISAYNNTMYGNNVGDTGNTCGWAQAEMDVNNTGTAVPWTVSMYNNIAQSTLARCIGTPNHPLYALTTPGPSSTNLIVGGTGKENILSALADGCQGSACLPTTKPYAAVSFSTQAALGTNLYLDPKFVNAPDFVKNHYGVPNCTGFDNVTACMEAVIADMTPTAVGTAGKGYQRPHACAPDADFPPWLKGIIYWHWDGTQVTMRDGLISKPCGL